MRARLLKPAYFRDVKLLQRPPLTRLLFSGLWCMADRDGRLEDDPLQIKIDVMPLDDVDTDAMLDDLAAGGFICRYQAHGRRYIQVVNFPKHQTPHVREPASVIPAPAEHGASTVLAPVQHGASHSVTLNPYTVPETVAELTVTGPGAETATAPASPSGDGQPAPYGANWVVTNGLVTATDWPNITWIDAAFEQSFWPEYPRKTHKAEAKKVFRVLCRGQPSYQRAYDLVERILEAVSEQSEHWQDPAYTPHAATYLRGERWADEVIIPTGRAATAAH